ncbi:tandem-95 repeat protein, partial [Variovorax sp. LARHSF232]
MFKPSQSRKRKASKGKAAIAAQTRLHLRPLEQRVLLDAAAVQTAQEVAAQGGAGMPPDDVTESGDADLIAALETSTDAAQAGAEQAANAIYFVDRSVPEVQTLVDALPSGAEVHYIEAGVDGVEFIAATLQGRSEVAAIHVLSHGEAGQLQLGSAELTAASMQGAYRDELLAIGQALTADADILVYGCDFGQGDVGGQAAELLSSLTGADVASSIDLTGAAELGGDWHLEREVGTVETRAVAADAWDHLLLAPTMSTTSFTIVSTTEDLGGTAAVTDPNVPPPARPGIAVSTFAVTTTDGDTSAAAPGIAIVGADNTHGQWWYSLNSGTTWAQLTNISDAHAMLLSRNVTTTRVFFQPHGDFNGTSTLTIRAWDKTSGADGQFVNITATGGTTAFSSTTAVGTLTLSAVADIMADTINGANAAVEDTAKVFNPIAGTGGATADAFEGSNPQITAIAGQAIVPGGTVAVTNGTVSLGADGQTLTFRGAADWSGTTTFSYTVTSGSVTETANIAMTVTAVADAPRIDLDTATAGADYAANYDQGAVAIGNLVSVTDPDGDNLASMTVTLTGATAADSLTLMGTVTGITASYNSATGVLTLSGNATPANYQTALGLVRFATTSGATTARTISVAATSSAVPIASNVAVATITPVDSDGDGVANAGDIDDDNDGLLDTREAGVSLIADGGFTASTFDSGWTANSENVFTASSQGIPNSTLTGGLFDELNPGGNADTGARGLYVNFDFADYYYSYAIPQNLSAGTYDFAFDLAKVPAFSDSSGTDFYRIVLYSGSATSPTTSIVLAAGTIQSLTTAFQNFSGSVTVASPGSYSILVQVNPNGAGNGDFVVDRLAFGRSGDKDQDSVPDRLDLDSDNDGITDNVEAQATAGYLAPSGQGSAVVDADDDGLDDRYDANTANASSAASLGLTPVDTDGDALADYLDADSDNDGKLDLTERGDGQPTSMTSTADTDRDGLLDIFEHGSVNDGFYVHDGSVTTSGSGLATTVVSINLADSDEDTAASGSDASPPARDFDWRDNVMTPAIDLNSAVGAADGSRDNTVSQTSGGAAVNLAMANADVSDFGDNDLASLRISLGGVQDGANEVLNIAGIDFALNADRSQAATVDGVDFLISYTVAGGFVITRNGGGAIAQAALDTLVRGMAYRHTLASATAGARTLSFVVTDAGGASSSAAVATVQVVPGNVAPVNTVPGARTVDEDSALAFTGANAISVNDADGNLASTHLTVGNGTLTVNLVGGATISGGANGTGTLTLSGTQAQINAALASLVYQGNANFNGADTLTVLSRDSAGVPLSDTDTVAITVNPVNDAPAAVDDTASTNEDTPLSSTVNLQANDSDLDGDLLSVVAGTFATSQGGSITIAADGSYTYTPPANFSGIDTVDYTVTDGSLTDVGRLTITVTAVNDTPVPLEPVPPTPGQTFNPATGNYAAETQEDTDFSGRVAATDADGDTLSYAVTTQPTHGTVTIDAATGAYTYTPTPDFNGSDSFVVTIADGNGGTAQTTVTMTVAAVADIAADTVTTVEDTLVNIAVLGNDMFENGGRSVTAINGAAVTVGTPIAVSNGTVTLRANGTLDFQPTANFNGATSFSYTVTSGGVTETASVTVNATASNDTPANTLPGAQSTSEDTAKAIVGVSVADIDSASLTSTVSVTGGTLSVTTGGGATITGNGSASVTLSGTAAEINAALAGLSYTPTADYNGTATLTLVTSDGSLNDTDTVAITVAAVADIAPDTVTTAEDMPINVAVLGNDSFENGGRSVTTVNGAAVTVDTPVAVSNGTVTLRANGTLDFQPAANFNGATSFSYTVSSGGVTETASVTVNVTASNDTPVPLEPIPPTPGQTFNPATGNYAAETQEDTDFSGRVAATDADGDTLSYAVTTQPTHGTVTIDAATGAYTYTPTPDFNGSDSFVVTIADGNGGTAQTTVTMTVAAVA